MSGFYKNVFLLLGTIIGAGIFSLPIALKSAGWLVFIILLLVLAFISIKINAYYRKVVESVEDRHQLMGYVQLILGNRWKYLAIFLHLFSIFGALLAYLIIAGDFLSELNIQTPEVNSFLFFLVAACLLLFAGRFLESLDVVFTVAKVILLLVLIVISATNLSKIDVPIVGSEPFFAYGAILFAQSGFSIIPELKPDKKINLSISSSQTLVLLIYLFFGFGLAGFLKGQSYTFAETWQKFVFNLSGVFAVFTPYLMLSWTGYDTFNKDLNFVKKDALILVTIIPLLLFLFGFKSFMAVVSLTGGVSLGGIGILICRMYDRKFKNKESWLIILIQIIFLFGILAELFQFLR